MNQKAKKLLLNQSKKLQKKEYNALNKKEIKVVKEKTDDMKEKISEKIPQKMIHTFESAFEKGFLYMFEKGTPAIEKTMNMKKIENGHDINAYILKKEFSAKSLKKFDNTVSQGILANQSISSLKSCILGLFGIGLPDIPVLIGMVLKTIYEICLKYGYCYDTKEEKVYILYLICTAVSKQEKRQKYSKLADDVAYHIEQNIKSEYQFEEIIKETAACLCAGVIGSKMLQGFVVIGVIGGIADFKLLNDISKIAKIKYKKRFLQKLQKEEL